MRIMSLAIGICLLARVTFAGDAIASFAKHSLGFDLASVLFGMTVPTNGEYGPTSPPSSTDTLHTAVDVSWMTNLASAKYNHDYSNRVLKFGFRNGRLVAVRISISAFSPQADDETVARRRKELIQMQEEYRKTNRTQKWHPDPAKFRIQYGAMCSPSSESLFLAEFQITPVEE